MRGHRGKIQAILPELHGMIGGGLSTLERANVIMDRDQPAKGSHDQPRAGAERRPQRMPTAAGRGDRRDGVAKAMRVGLRGAELMEWGLDSPRRHQVP